MKATIARVDLGKALADIVRVVERRNTIPILGNVAIETEDDALVVRGTDLDMVLTARIPAQIAAPGGTTLTAATLNDIVRRLPDGAQVSLTAIDDGARMELRSGRAKFTLQTLPLSDFPDIDVGDYSHTFTAPAKTFASLLARTQFAIPNEETRYYLNGSFVHVADAGDGTRALTAVSTTGHMLARVRMAAPDGADGMPGIIVPRKAVERLIGLCEGLGKDEGQTLSIELSAGKLRARIGAAVFVSKTIDGTFPDYSRVIPAGNEKVALFDRQTLARAVERVATLRGEKGTAAVAFDFETGKAKLTVNNPDAGMATDEIDADYDADPLRIGMNAGYVGQILGAIGGEMIHMRMSDPGSPIVLDARGATDMLAVLMPMRV